MGVEVEQTTGGVLQGWRRHHHHLARESLHVMAADAHVGDTRLADLPRFSSPETALEALLEEQEQQQQQLSVSTAIVDGRKEVTEQRIMQEAATSTFSFERSSGQSKSLIFQTMEERRLADQHTRGVKRYRHAQDVDGPNTAGLSCKKRRLRAQLITSRLSQPFSQPATHILNREGMKAGDKRFMKMATSIDTARRISHLHATSFLRFSLMNSLRRRLGVARPGVAPIRPVGRKEEVEATLKTPWQPHRVEDSPGTKYPRTPVPSNLSTVCSATADRSKGIGKPIIAPVAKGPSCRLSKPAALPQPSSDVGAVHERTSPHIHPIASPELRPLCTYDDLDEDSFAFMHADYDDDDLNDEPEHVYSDFSVIFGGGATSSEPASSDDDHTYEEYIDELDGITWVSR